MSSHFPFCFVSDDAMIKIFSSTTKLAKSDKRLLLYFDKRYNAKIVQKFWLFGLTMNRKIKRFLPFDAQTNRQRFEICNDLISIISPFVSKRIVNISNHFSKPYIIKSRNSREHWFCQVISVHPYVQETLCAPSPKNCHAYDHRRTF